MGGTEHCANHALLVAESLTVVWSARQEWRSLGWEPPPCARARSRRGLRACRGGRGRASARRRLPLPARLLRACFGQRSPRPRLLRPPTRERHRHGVPGSSTSSPRTALAPSRCAVRRPVGKDRSSTPGTSISRTSSRLHGPEDRNGAAARACPPSSRGRWCGRRRTSTSRPGASPLPTLPAGSSTAPCNAAPSLAADRRVPTHGALHERRKPLV